MGQDNYKQKIRKALAVGATHDAAVLLAEWAKGTPAKAENDPVYFLLCSKVWHQQGNADKCMWNLNKALELLVEE